MIDPKIIRRQTTDIDIIAAIANDDTPETDNVEPILDATEETETPIETTVTCPTCDSTNIVDIHDAHDETLSQLHCRDCDHEWALA